MEEEFSKYLKMQAKLKSPRLFTHSFKIREMVPGASKKLLMMVGGTAVALFALTLVVAKGWLLIFFLLCDQSLG